MDNRCQRLPFNKLPQCPWLRGAKGPKLYGSITALVYIVIKKTLKGNKFASLQYSKLSWKPQQCPLIHSHGKCKKPKTFSCIQNALGGQIRSTKNCLGLKLIQRTCMMARIFDPSTIALGKTEKVLKLYVYHNRYRQTNGTLLIFISLSSGVLPAVIQYL